MGFEEACKLLIPLLCQIDDANRYIIVIGTGTNA